MGGFSSDSGQSSANRTKTAQNKRNRFDDGDDGGPEDNQPPKPQTYVAPPPTVKKASAVTGVSNIDPATSGGTFGTSFFSNQPTDITQKQFVAGIGEGATKDDLISNVMGGVAGVFEGAAPFRTRGVDRTVMTNLGLDPGVVPTDATVESQAFAPDVSGGDPGVGLQGFGAKMMGGEGQIIGADGIPTEFEAIPTTMANSDLVDPNAQMPMPGQAVITDQAYNIPTAGGAMGFIPNSPKAYQYMQNPFAGRMMNTRSGFGKSLFT